MSLVKPASFNERVRMLNTNVDGNRKVGFALTSIVGVGRRYAHLLCKKAEIDANRRAGSLTNEEIDLLCVIMSNNKQHKVPDWFVNRQKDRFTGKTYQTVGQDVVIGKIREDLQRMGKNGVHRAFRHSCLHKVKGQHTKTTGRKGIAPGYPGKKEIKITYYQPQVSKDK